MTTRPSSNQSLPSPVQPLRVERSRDSSVCPDSLHAGAQPTPSKPVVLLIGRSLFIAAVAATLRRRQTTEPALEMALEIVQLDPQRPNFVQQVQFLQPALVITEGRPEELRPLLALTSPTVGAAAAEPTSNGAMTPSLLYFDQTTNYQMLNVDYRSFPAQHLQDLLDIIYAFLPQFG